MPLKITIKTDDGKEYEIAAILVTPTPPVPPTPPIPPIPPTPPTTPSLYFLNNCINWGPDALKLGVKLFPEEATENTHFVNRVAANGSLMDVIASQHTKFVADVHSRGKKATFSIAGGTNSIADITMAVTEKFRLVNAIKSHMNLYGYDGVTIDIEATAINSQVMKDFVLLLRTALGDKIIGCYIQGYQLDTVWNKLNEYKDSLNWVSIMYYDSGVFSFTLFNSLNARLAAKIGADKVLAGIAVNYPVGETGVSVELYGQIIDTVVAKGYKGIGIWNNALYIEPWKAMRKSKINVA